MIKEPSIFFIRFKRKYLLESSGRDESQRVGVIGVRGHRAGNSGFHEDLPISVLRGVRHRPNALRSSIQTADVMRRSCAGARERRGGDRCRSRRRRAVNARIAATNRAVANSVTRGAGRERRRRRSDRIGSRFQSGIERLNRNHRAGRGVRGQARTDIINAGVGGRDRTGRERAERHHAPVAAV